MRAIIIKQWAEISSIWKKIYDNNPAAASFQSYEFLSFTGKGKSQRKNILRLAGVKELNVVLYNDDEPVVIAPLLVKKQKDGHFVCMRGHFTTADHLDFIYADLSYEDIEFLLDGIRNLLGKVTFLFDRVPDRFISCQFFKRYFATTLIEKHEAYAIPVPARYEDWFGNLHKSVRQNLRTAMNRIAKDQLALSTDFYVGTAVDSKTYNEMLSVYADRFLVKNRFNFGPLKTLVKKLLLFILVRDKASQWLNKAANNFHAVLLLNNEIAAFASGLIFKDKRVMLSRLNMLTKYSKYSPGGLLISSMVKYFVEQKEAGKLDIDIMDLSQGGHKKSSYKISYGGQLYYNYVFYG